MTPESLWTLTVAVPPGGRVEREVCVFCAAELRRFLLAEPPHRVSPEPAASRRQGRVLDALLRGAMYLSIAVAFFFVATWLVSR